MAGRVHSAEESGILVTPPVPGRKPRRDTTRARVPGGRSRLRRVLPWFLAIALLAGGGFTAHQIVMADDGDASELAAARADAEAQRRAADDASARVVALEKELTEARASAATETQKLVAEKQALEAKAKESAALEKKLADVLGDGGTVTRDGEEIRLELVDKVLFDLGDDQLTPRGEVVMYEVGEALKDKGFADKQIWVQGHTDRTPIRAAKGVTPRFATNWELSAARALTVVHYLQDEAKIAPRRLAAVAFGEHRPASKNKAKNRRIEIVLYPKHTVARR
jgi:chemotaxis protein MotB